MDGEEKSGEVLVKCLYVSMFVHVDGPTLVEGEADTKGWAGRRAMMKRLGGSEGEWEEGRAEGWV